MLRKVCATPKKTIGNNILKKIDFQKKMLDTGKKMAHQLRLKFEQG